MNNKYYKLIEEAIDSFGLIAQLPSDNRDGGDTLQREGMFAIAVAYLHKLGKLEENEYKALKQRYSDNISMLECAVGTYRRHLDPDMWYSYCDRMSRDQWTPNVIAMGLLELNRPLNRTFIGHLRRLLLFAANTRRNWVYPPDHPKHTADQDYSWKLPDFTVLSSWGYYIRAYKAWYLYPLLLICDLDLVFNSLIWLFKFSLKPNDTDILNHTCSLLQAKWSISTPLSWLARKMLSSERVLECLEKYFTPNGPKLHLVFKDFLEEVW